MSKYKIKTREKGSILVLVLWALGLLTVFAIYLGVGARARIDFLNRIETRSKTFYMAEAGIKQAVSGIANLDKKKSYLALNDICSKNRNIFSAGLFDAGDIKVGYEYQGDDFSYGQNDGQLMMSGVCDVQAKLNINVAGREELMALLIETADIEAEAADQIASAIIDWRDKDNNPLAKGAENQYYQGLKNAYACKDSAFETIEELRYVRGIDYNTYKYIEPYITVFGTGKININTASTKVLKALGLSEALTKKIINYRCGADAIEADGDDQVFDNLSSVVARLSQVESLSASEVAELSNLVASGRLTIFSNTFLIESRANLKNKQDICRISCVLEKGLDENFKKAGLILSWRTGYFKLAQVN
jgi:general secretion pathway protein K